MQKTGLIVQYSYLFLIFFSILDCIVRANQLEGWTPAKNIAKKIGNKCAKRQKAKLKNAN